MKQHRIIIIAIFYTLIGLLGCKKEESTPEPDFSKPHEKSVTDFDYYFKSSGGSINVSKFNGTIKSTVKTFDYPFNATAYNSDRYYDESSITRTENQGDIKWSVIIYRFDPTNVRPSGGYNNIKIQFDINNKNMPTSSYKLETFDDQNKTDSTVSISASYSKWLANNQVHTTGVDFTSGKVSADLINVTITSFDASTGLLKGSFGASGKEENTGITANLEGTFEVYLVEIVR